MHGSGVEMKFKNVSPLGDLEVPVLGRVVKAGEVFEVPADLGESFAAQSDVWEPVTAKKGDD
jgi:hypothetical protein